MTTNDIVQVTLTTEEIGHIVAALTNWADQLSEMAQDEALDHNEEDRDVKTWAASTAPQVELTKRVLERYIRA